MGAVLAPVGLAGLMLLAAGPQQPIASYDDLGRAVAACVRGDDPAAGAELELRFTLTSRGTLAGKPSIALARAPASMGAQRALVATLRDALRRCVPFSLTPAFAEVVAGKPVTIRVLTRGRAVVV